MSALEPFGSPMSKQRSNYMAKADVLFAKMIKERDVNCQNCGSVDNRQTAHLISRSYKSIRCDPDNAVCLCRSCHIKYTMRPLEWRQWVEERFPGRWDALTKKALTYPKVDWKSEYHALSVGSVEP